MRALIALLLLWPSLVMAEVLKMASLEWPPYAGAELPGQGTFISTVRAALKTQGHQLEVTFLPWQRTVLLVKQGTGYLAYGPEYSDPKRDKLFYVSDRVGHGPLGIAYRKASPLFWRQLSDLYAFHIGVVRDYVNTPAFDDAVAAGLQKVDLADSDRQNLLKLVFGRVDGVVVDSAVLDYWLGHDKKLKAHKDELTMGPQLLADKGLFLNFRRSEEGRRWQAILNKGLKALHSSG
ncbi:transporter substrate-binding domain-containing protein [Gallaecimonas kandeliae]|uniref:substrate-binding periplasmic protein n=1 Tax=Gallaecimonas kandeliae TaxID=3029055 RepID=UPI002649FA8D|nr:transporter substrate-binding domain-containing protein [Gallaecimonas kandeliae]WKE64721.1 transporter substrate-binding domain-containing protein [Gallaecimonas kandeliae]